MKIIVIFIFSLLSLQSCKTKNNFVIQKSTKSSNVIAGDTIKITNKDLEYEVVIVDAGFSTWLNSRCFPRGYHSESFLEFKNQIYVSEWNNRVLQPQKFDSNLYEMNINYDTSIHYGYEVNYLIYNYMIYFQNTFKQKLFGNVPIR